MPDGSLVQIQSAATNGYYRTRGSRYIALNRQSTGTIAGNFQCQIPDASQTSVDLYINIGMENSDSDDNNSFKNLTRDKVTRSVDTYYFSIIYLHLNLGRHKKYK